MNARKLIIVVALIAIILGVTLSAYWYYMGAKPAAREKVLTIALAWANVGFAHQTPRISSDDDYKVLAAMNDLFFARDKNFKIQPYLVESYSLSSDELVYTWNLKKGVRFHDGYPFNATAVKFTFDRANDPEMANPRASLTASVERVEIVDAYTVKIYLKHKDAFFLDNMANGYAGQPMDPQCVSKYGKDYGIKMFCGTGPFKWGEWVPGDHITLVRNEEYNWAPAFTGHTGPAKVDKIVFRYITEDTVRTVALITGDIDIGTNYPAMEVKHLKAVPDKVNVLTSTSTHTKGLIMNAKTPPLDDVRVRLAIAHALNRTEFSQYMLGLDSVTYSVLNPISLWGLKNPEDIVPKFDLNLAKALLNEAGYTMGDDGFMSKDGKRLTIKGLQYNEPTYTALDVILQGQLKKIGIDLAIELLDWPTWSYRVRTLGDQHLGIIGLADEPAGMIRIFHSSNIGKSNQMWFGTPELDSLLDRGVAEMDPVKRAQIYDEVNRLITTEYAITQGLTNTMYADGYGLWVKNYDFTYDKRVGWVGTGWFTLDLDVDYQAKQKLTGKVIASPPAQEYPIAQGITNTIYSDGSGGTWLLAILKGTRSHCINT
jgi:peptide/nickel transport system substrate-binding protein